MFQFKGTSKNSNKILKGSLIQVGRKYYIIKPKEFTCYMRADYIFFKGGRENFEVKKETIEQIV